MKPPSTLSSKRIRQSLGTASGYSWLLFALSTFVVIMGAWNLQAQSGDLRSKGPEVPVSSTSLPPQTAIVTWDNRGLGIQAWNSSLNDILREIAARTGAKLEGLTQDQRIFGSYGPGTGSDVLSKLLEGSAYNVLIFRGHGAHSPLTILLSARLPLSPHTNVSGQTRRHADTVKPVEPDRETAEAPAATGSLANQDPYNIGGTPHDPVQFMQEILNRQQLIDQKEQSEGSHQPQ